MRTGTQHLRIASVLSALLLAACAGVPAGSPSGSTAADKGVSRSTSESLPPTPSSLTEGSTLPAPLSSRQASILPSPLPSGGVLVTTTPRTPLSADRVDPTATSHEFSVTPDSFWRATMVSPGNEIEASSNLATVQGRAKAAFVGTLTDIGGDPNTVDSKNFPWLEFQIRLSSTDGIKGTFRMIANRLWPIPLDELRKVMPTREVLVFLIWRPDENRWELFSDETGIMDIREGRLYLPGSKQTFDTPTIKGELTLDAVFADSLPQLGTLPWLVERPTGPWPTR